MSLYELFKEKRKAKKALDKFNFGAENVRRKFANEEPLLRKRDRIKLKFAKIYPPLRPDFKPESWYDRVFVSRTRENAFFCLIRNIVFLEVFGLIMYSIFGTKYFEDPRPLGTGVAICVHALLSVMFIFPTVMYYFILATQRVLASKVRTLLLIILVTIAFEVPATNTLNNFQTVAQGIACVQQDISQSLGEVDQNIAKNGEFGVDLMQKFVKAVANPLNRMKGMLRSVDRKVSRVVDVYKQAWETLSDLTNKCKGSMRGPYLMCVNIFYEGYLRCLSTERYLGTDLCASINRANALCDSSKHVGESVCEMPKKAAGGITEAAVPFFKVAFTNVVDSLKDLLYFHIKGYKWVVGKGKTFKEEIKNLNTLGIRVEDTGVKKTSSIVQLGKNVKNSIKGIVETYKATLHLIVEIIHWTVLPFTLFWPFFSTALFVYKFNYREEYKNKYITSEFTKIDDNCALKGKSKLLPLYKNEKEEYQKRGSWKMTVNERKTYHANIALTLIMSVTPVFFMLIDVFVYLIIYGAYDIFSRIHVDVPTHYELKISGDGYAAKIMNTLLDTFSPVTSGVQERHQRWKDCFEDPTPPNVAAYIGMFILIIVCLILCRAKVWLSRQTLALADYFYPHRVRPRALMLYNKILNERKNLMGMMMAQQKATLADDNLAGKEALVRRSLQSRGFIRVNCVVCRKSEMRLADTANTRLCVHCGAFYCIDCFSMNQFCKDCDTNMQVLDGIELYFEAIEGQEDDEE